MNCHHIRPQIVRCARIISRIMRPIHMWQPQNGVIGLDFHRLASFAVMANHAWIVVPRIKIEKNQKPLQKSIKLLMKAISSTGGSWQGLKPYQGRYFWEALGRTVLSFGCLAWHHSTRKKAIRMASSLFYFWGDSLFYDSLFYIVKFVLQVGI